MADSAMASAGGVRQADDRRITLTATQQYNMWLISLVIIPVGIFGSGIYTWWRRR